MANLTSESTLLQKIIEKKKDDDMLIKKKIIAQKKGDGSFSLSDGGISRYKGRVCVPDDKEVKSSIMREAHTTPYLLHPGSTKMYNDLKILYWWPGMKNDIANYGARYFICNMLKLTRRTFKTSIDSRMEAGGYCYGFCDRVATNS